MQSALAVGMLTPFQVCCALNSYPRILFKTYRLNVGYLLLFKNMKRLKDLTPEERLGRRLKGLPEDPMDEFLEGLIGPVIGAVGIITLMLISLITG